MGKEKNGETGGKSKKDRNDNNEELWVAERKGKVLHTSFRKKEGEKSSLVHS